MAVPSCLSYLVKANGRILLEAVQKEEGTANYEIERNSIVGAFTVLSTGQEPEDCTTSMGVQMHELPRDFRTCPVRPQPS